MPEFMDYRPIPGQVDIPTDDLTQKAMTKASNLLVPYQQRFGLKPIANPTSPPVPEAQASPAADSRLYEAIHPNTFSQVLETIMQLVTGRPIPKYQEGTEKVPETGPAIVHEGEKIIPASQNPAAGGSAPLGPGYEIPPGGEGMGMAPGAATRAYELTAKPWVDLAAKGWNALGSATGSVVNPAIEKGIVNPLVYITQGQWPATNYPPPTAGVAPIGPELASSRPTNTSTLPGSYPVTTETTKPIPSASTDVMSGITKRPLEGGGMEYTLPGTQGVMTVGPPVLGDQRAREGVLASAGGGGGFGYGGVARDIGPWPDYWSAHPQEREAQTYLDMIRPSQDELARENMEMTRLNDMSKDRNVPKSARMMAGARLNTMIEARATRDVAIKRAVAGIYEKGIEQGGKGAEDIERLAHAEYLRTIPGMEMTKAREANAANIAATMAQVQGHIEAANIAAGTRNQILSGLNTWLSNKEKHAAAYNTPFDPMAETAQYMRIMKNMGQVSEEDWAKMPEGWKQEPWTEQRLRMHLTDAGMKPPDIDKYIERAKKSGKLYG